MAIGRQAGILRAIERAPRRGPQSFTRGLLLADVIGWTRGERAAELVAFPSSVSRTYFGPYKPGTAQRIPPLINTGYGRNYASEERVRVALVARTQMFVASLQLPSSTAEQVSSRQVDVGAADAADSQAARVALT